MFDYIFETRGLFAISRFLYKNKSYNDGVAEKIGSREVVKEFK